MEVARGQHSTCPHGRVTRRFRPGLGPGVVSPLFPNDKPDTKAAVWTRCRCLQIRELPLVTEGKLPRVTIFRWTNPALPLSIVFCRNGCVVPEGSAACCLQETVSIHDIADEPLFFFFF